MTFFDSGEVDALVEVIGCALALDMLDIDRVYASALPTGLGMVRTEHGLMPVPGPVVLELLRGVPTYSRGIPAELVNATGAAILASVAEGYGDMPTMRSDVVGYGAGAQQLDDAERPARRDRQRAAAVGRSRDGGARRRATSSSRRTCRSDARATAPTRCWRTRLPRRRRRRVVRAGRLPGRRRPEGFSRCSSPPDRLEPLLRLARDRADGGLVRVESVRRVE